MNHKEILLELKDNLGKPMEIKKIIEDKILKEGDELLYFVKSGSHLYGLETETSDLDLKGIILPSKKSLFLDRAVEQYGPYSSGGDNKANSNDDIDLELWSIHKFFKMLQTGDTNAYDILYSNNSNSLEFCNSKFTTVFTNSNKLLGSKPIRGSFIGYSYGQVKRYEAKGFNFATLKSILKYFKELEKNLDDFNGNDRLAFYGDDLIYYVNEENDELQIEVKETDKDIFLRINDYKDYPIGIRVKQFRDSIQKWASEYGSRVRNNDDGVDWKNISHAFRVLKFADKLATEGDFSYPFSDEEREELLAIKNGEVDFKEIVSRLREYVDEVEEKLENTDKLRSKPDAKRMREIILSFYGM